MKKHLGSLIASICGAIVFAVGVIKPSSLVITGLVVLLGSFAYRSAKKRKLREVENSVLRISYEWASIVCIIVIILLQKNVKQLIVTEPVSYLFIPLLVIIVYALRAWMFPSKQ